jgi:hypothetical protein
MVSYWLHDADNPEEGEMLVALREAGFCRAEAERGSLRGSCR